jgi:flagellar protein FliO/FliZ
MQNWQQYVVSILVVLALLALVLWGMTRKGMRRNLSGLGQRIQIQESLSLGLRHKLVLVQVDEQRVLLSVSPSEVKTLHAWSSPDSTGIAHGDSSQTD